MSLWSLFTWLSIWVLIGGSIAIFVWFCRDVARLLREERW